MILKSVKTKESEMPIYDYKCKECDSIFEVQHGMNEKQNNCNLCGSSNIKKLFSSINFHVIGGTEKFSTHGYSGRHQDLVKRMKGNKDYRDSFRKERGQEENKGLSDWKAEQEMAKSQDIFQKMKAEGEKMTSEEKKKIKEEYGIKKGMKSGKMQF